MKIRTELLRMSADEYHADPAPISLSSSVAKILASESPEEAWLAHPRLGGQARKATRATGAGALAHRLLLGAGQDVAIVDAPDRRKKATREALEAGAEAGKIAVLSADYERAEKATGEIAKKMSDLGIVLDGESELVMLWGDQGYDLATVQCRGMLDHIKASTIYELKSAEDVSPEAIARAIDEYGYAIQAEAYRRGLEQIRPADAGRLDFVFVFFKLEPPYSVTPVRLSGEYRELGRRQWKGALDLWAQCLESGKWPGHAGRIITVEPPPWVLLREQDRMIRRMEANDRRESKR